MPGSQHYNIQAAMKYKVQTNKNLTLGVVAHAFNPSTREAKAGRSLSIAYIVLGQLGLPSESLSLNKYT